jgi:hypothetical protein
MKKRSLFLALAAGVLLWGFGALEARAGQVILPTTLDKLLPAGSFAVVPTEPDTFSNFRFTSSSIPPTGVPLLDPAAINVAEFHTLNGLENGLTFSGSFAAPAGTEVDYSIFYTVTAPKGFLINDALLSGVFGQVGGTGTASVAETIFDANGVAIATMEISKPGNISDTVNFAGQTAIAVEKDISIIGGSNGASVSIINQGYSSSGGKVPEPTSMALLGIGMTGFFAFRRFFKRASVA